MGANDTITVQQLDVDILTLDHLQQFLRHHGWPDTVHLAPSDFYRLCRLVYDVTAKMPTATAITLLGTLWIRGHGDSTELDWQSHDLRRLER